MHKKLAIAKLAKAKLAKAKLAETKLANSKLAKAKLAKAKLAKPKIPTITKLTKSLFGVLAPVSFVYSPNSACTMGFSI